MASDSDRPGPYERLSNVRRLRAGATATLFGLGPLALMSLVYPMESGRTGPGVVLGMVFAILTLALMLEPGARRAVYATYTSEMLMVPHAHRHGRAANLWARVALYLGGACWAVGFVVDRVLSPLAGRGDPGLGDFLTPCAVVLVLGGIALKALFEPGEPEAAARERVAELRARAAGLHVDLEAVADDLARRLDLKLSELEAVGERVRVEEELRRIVQEESRPALKKVVKEYQRSSARSGLVIQIALAFGAGIAVNWISTVYLGL